VQACRAFLPGFKVPRSLAIVDALPRLGTQKVDIEACRRILESGVAKPPAGSTAFPPVAPI
jgi:acyl-CoA synthetase (AMP-forming)/AMP-acid ligase II